MSNLNKIQTNAPRFTASYGATKSEIYVSVILLSNLLISQFIHHVFYFRLSSFLLFIFLILFLANRFIKRNVDPPNAFVFVFIGVFIGFLGSFLFLMSTFFELSNQLNILVRLLYFQGFVLSFVLGVGSRLIPALLGHDNQVINPTANHIQLNLKAYLIIGILFFISYFIEAFVDQFLGSNIRSSIIMFLSIFIWKIYKRPVNKSFLTYGLILSCWFLFLGHLIANIITEYYIHFIHIFYVGGLSLMTFIIASRVSISHGGHDLTLEKKSWHYPIFVFLIILACLTRVSAGFLPDIYLNHLYYASAVWILGAITWGILIMKKIIVLR